MKSFFLALLLSIFALPASAEEAPKLAPKLQCGVAAQLKKALLDSKGKWSAMSAGQWQFLRGIYVLNPNTAAGLPPGDSAALAQVAGDAGGMIFFIDGAKACAPMNVPPALVDLLNRIGKNEIVHVGAKT